MAGILAICAFVVALVLHIAGGHAGSYWVDAELAGFILLAIHWLWPWRPWARP